MKATLVSIAAVVAILIGASAWGQEIVGAPQPAAPTVAPAAVVQPVAAKVVVGPSWRYRWYGNRWWYWTPANQGMWYGPGGWTVYAPAAAPAVVYSPGYVYPYPYGYGYYPYGPVYYGPGVGVGVWGGRGFVRAGRVVVRW
jgi:hypothetical protein